MTAAVTSKRSYKDSTDGTSYTCTAFVPTAGSLLLVFVTASNTQDDPHGALTDSQSLGWEYIIRARFATNVHETVCFVAKKLAAASSMTVTFACGGDAATGADIEVVEITGVTRTGWSAVYQFQYLENQAVGTPSIGMSATLSTSATIAIVGNSTNPAGINPPTGFTEIVDTGYTTPATGSEIVYQVGSVSGTQTWGSSSASAFGVILIEIDATPQLCIQSEGREAGAGTGTFVQAFKQNITAGSTLMVVVYWNSGSSTITGVADSNGSYTSFAAVLRGAGGNSGWSYQAWYRLNSPAGANTVTVTFSAGPSLTGVALLEIPGIYSAFDHATTSNYNGTTPVSSSYTPAFSSSFIVTGAFFQGGPGTPGGGFNIEEFRSIGLNPVGDKLVSSPSAQQATWGTTGAQDVSTIIGSFYTPVATSGMFGWIR